MSIKNKRGSVLVGAVLVLAVLSILSVSVLGFMTTENKQAMYNQNKTQAYFIAKSGADTVEAALISQLTTYSDNTNLQKAFLGEYNAPQSINVSIDGVKEVIVMNKQIGSNRILTVESTAEYRDIEQTVSKAIYSVVTEIDSGSQGISVSNAPLMYIDSAKQRTNKGEANIPSHIASQVEEGTFPLHKFDEVTEAQWATESPDVVYTSNTGTINSGAVIIGSEGTTTNIYVNGPLTIGGNITFKGKVNIYVRGNLIINQGTKVYSDSKAHDDFTEYFLNIYVYNESEPVQSLGLSTPLKLHLTFTGNLYIKQGKIDLDFHQDAYITGNIIYNGNELNIGTQSNNINNAKKILDGSIYAPNSEIYIGFKNDKTAFILDGMIFGRNLYLYANNNTQANKFYGAIRTSGTVNVPVNTNTTIKTRTVNYQSYYID